MRFVAPPSRTNRHHRGFLVAFHANLPKQGSLELQVILKFTSPVEPKSVVFLLDAATLTGEEIIPAKFLYSSSLKRHFKYLPPDDGRGLINMAISLPLQASEVTFDLIRWPGRISISDHELPGALILVAAGEETLAIVPHRVGNES